jgi:hypothetical protein
MKWTTGLTSRGWIERSASRRGAGVFTQQQDVAPSQQQGAGVTLAHEALAQRASTGARPASATIRTSKSVTNRFMATRDDATKSNAVTGSFDSRAVVPV